MSQQTVVVTGASAGVGRAVAHEYARRGANVGLLARGQAGLDGAAAEVRDLGGTPLTIPTDVADSDAVETAAARVEAELGPIDVWVNNAMVTIMGRTWEIAAGEFRRVTEVTYLGYVHGTLAALRRMRPRDRGTIIQVGSALAYRGIPLQGPYCAAKHAIQGFTESLRVELLEEGSAVRVGEVHLPALNTPQFTWGRNKMPKAPQPVPPIYQPEVAARSIVWAADTGRPETWVAGSTAATIMGNRLARPLVARYLARTGFDGQQTDLPADAYPDDNLFSAADAEEDRGTRGPFDDRARETSPLEVASRHRGALAAAGAGALTLAVGAIAAIRR